MSEGYICVFHIKYNFYEIVKTQFPAKEPLRRSLSAMIYTKNMDDTEKSLLDRFFLKKLIYNIFELDDKDLSYIHQIPDEWEDYLVQLV